MAPEPFRARAARFATLFALALVCVATPAHALRYLNWNILNYPGTTGAVRDPFYRVVIAPLSPDVITTEETWHIPIGRTATIPIGVSRTMSPRAWAN